MAKLLYRLGLGSARHRLAVVLTWIVVVIAVGVGSATLSGQTVNTFNIPGQESTKALDILGQKFGAGASGAAAQVVFQTPGDITAGNNTAEVNKLVGELRAIPGVDNASDPYAPDAGAVSADKTTLYSNVAFKVQPPEVTEAQKAALTHVLDEARAAGFTAEMIGTATDDEGAPGASATEGIGVIVALAVLALTYGGLALAGMNLVTALVGVAIGALGVTIVSGFVDLQSTTPILATMLGLAVGIDYALFIITRYRQELRNGLAVPDAAALAVGTAGSAVVTAGLTVVIALAGLAIAGIPFLTEMGLAAAATIVVAVLVAVTLVPAALGFLGQRALSKKERRGDAAAVRRNRGFFQRWATMTTKGRWPALILSVAVLAIVAVPFFSMRTTLATPPADNTTQSRAQAILQAKYGNGVIGPITVLVDGQGAVDRAATIVTQAQGLQGVVFASAAGALPDGSAALVTVIPNSAPDADETVTLVHDLRSAIKASATSTSPPAYVTGTTAVSVDVSQKLNEALPLYLLVVVGLAMVLLVLVFRSLLVPLVGVAGFLLTIGASFGATVAVFQWGWLYDVFQPGATGPLLSLMPIIIVGILFGLAMDYQVFLVSRIHEAHAHGVGLRASVMQGFQQAAPVVLAAATIMLSVFAGFYPDGNATIKPIAFALAIGILFDAVVVRMILMPAAITIMGRAAWWFPGWLQWLPKLDVEGSALEHPKA